MMLINPIKPFLDASGYLLLDGGLSTELEHLGYDLNHPLWTARFIENHPEAIKQAHVLNFAAGAGCVISSSYQASVPGLVKSGYTREAARSIVEKSYRIAEEACAEFYGGPLCEKGRLKPIVAASIGPYGACLADGSEYRGDYGLPVDELVEFHSERFEILSSASRLLAIETIPSYLEALAIRELISQSETAAWVCFSCKDGVHINDGKPIEDAVSVYNDLPQVIGVGVNCTAPEYISQLISRIRRACPQKEVVVYPNSGERFCAETKVWETVEHTPKLMDLAPEWYGLGARLIGGCCRTTSAEIRRLHHVLTNAID